MSPLPAVTQVEAYFDFHPLIFWLFANSMREKKSQKSQIN